MTTVFIDGGLEKVRRDLRATPKAMALAQNRTINDTHSKLKTRAMREVAKAVGLPQKEIKKKAKLKRSTLRTLSAWIAFESRWLNVIKFVTPGRQRVGAFKKQTGVTAKPWGRRKTFTGSFIGRGRGSGALLVFKRATDNSRAPVEPVYGPNVAKEFLTRELEKVYDRVVDDSFNKRFVHNLMYYLGKIK